MLIKQMAPGDVYPGAIQEIQLAGADKGVALSTTAAFTLVPDGTQQIELLLRNLSTAVVGKWVTTPYLIVLKTTDLLAAVANVTDYSTAAANATTGDVVLSSLDTLANGDALWVGSHVPFRGLNVTITAANGNASVLTGTYWDGSALTDISLTDNTVSAGKTFGSVTTATITWTVPTAWAKAALSAIVSPTDMAIPYRDEPLYWARLVVSAALDASTTLASMQAMSRSTAYANLIAAPPGFAFRCFKGPGGISGIEALTDAGTGNLIINCATRLGADGLGL